MAKKKSTTSKSSSRSKKTTAKSKKSTTRKAEARSRSSAKKTTRGGTSRRKPATRSSSRSRSSRSAAKKKPALKKPTLTFNFNARRKAIVAGLLSIFATLILILSLVSASQGWLTAWVLNALWTVFGWGMPVALAAFGLAGIYAVMWGMERPPRFPLLKTTGWTMLFLVFEGFATLIAVLQDNGLPTVEAVTQAQVGGGFVGGLLYWTLTNMAGTAGAILSLTAVGLVAGFFVTGFNLKLRRPAAARKPVAAGVREILPLPDGQPQQVPLPFNRKSKEPPTEEPDAEAKPWEEKAEPQKADKKTSRLLGRRKKKEEPAAATPAAPAGPEPIFLGRQAAAGRRWELPVLANMLNAGDDHEVEDGYIRHQQHIIVDTLESFGAPSRIIEINKGPTIIQYGVEPLFIEQRSGKRTKVKVGKIASLADDLALALAAKSVRIQAPVPGKGYVGIEVPNESKALVSLRDVMEARSFTSIAKKSKLAIGLGQDVAGQPKSIDLTKMPHMLIAGATGSGKSVCVNGIIACLLLQNTPDELQFVMVDPKRVELIGYNGIPHLAAPVIVDMDRVLGTLQWALREMDNRYKRFAEIGARNITDCNLKLVKQGKPKLPYIVIVIDELADLMMVSPEDTEKSIARLAQMARATGIHVIIATQRPSVDVVTGLIKANFPARIAFAVASSTDSRVVLDSTGAERLLGQGDMLFQSPDAPAPVRMQGCFVSDDELDKIIDYWKHARRFAPEDKAEQNLIPAATDVIKKEELDQDVWDVPTEQEAQEKAQMDNWMAHKAQEAKKASNSKLAKPAPPPAPIQGGKPMGTSPKRQTEPVPPPDLSKLVDSQADEPETSSPPPAAEPETALEAGGALKAPPLWDDMREDLIQAQEEAIRAKEINHDELWDDALALILELGKASTSLLQRRFRIGYTRAARLIDRMEEEGIIGPPTGTSKAREVLITELP